MVEPVEGLVAWARRHVDVGEWRVVRDMPWARVVRFSTPDGPVVWGKAMRADLAYEVDLLPLLAAASPCGVVAPIAGDRRRGLLLLPDGGATVADLPTDAPAAPAAPDAARAAWTAAVRRYAEVQHASAGLVERMLTAGVPDLRPAAAARAVRALADEDHGLTAEEAQRLRDLAVPHAASVAASLADSALPATVQHDDLQPSNALADGRWLDWGDASVAHPFASLLTLLGGRSGRPDAPSPVRAAYLGAWAELTGVPMARLEREAELAVQLAPVGRALAWLRAGPDALAAYPGQVTRWLRTLLPT